MLNENSPGMFYTPINDAGGTDDLMLIVNYNMLIAHSGDNESGISLNRILFSFQNRTDICCF